jgi:hypothetical protein
MYGDTTVNDGGFVKLDFPITPLKWSSGNAKLASLIDADPTQYFGGWSAPVIKRATDKAPETKYPELDMPIYDRVGANGSEYQSYARSAAHFFVLCARERFVLYQRDAEREIVKNKNGFPVVLKVAPKWEAGLSPEKEVIMLAMNGNKTFGSPVFLKLYSWYAYASFNKAMKNASSIGHQAALLLGTHGEDRGGKTVPKLEKYKADQKNLTTPIELLGSYQVEPDGHVEAIWQKCQAWLKCASWNKFGVFENTEDELPPMPDDLPIQFE